MILHPQCYCSFFLPSIYESPSRVKQLKIFDGNRPQHYNCLMGLRSATPGRRFFWPIFALTLILIWTCVPSAFAARNSTEIHSVRMMDGSDSDFVVSAGKNFQFYMYALKNPDRLVVDCRPARLPFPITATLKEEHPDVIRVRANQFQKDVVRIVFDLKHQAKYSALMNGNDLRIRIVSKSIAAPAAETAKTDIEMSLSTEDQKRSVQVQKPKNKKDTLKSRVKMKGYLVDKFRRNVVRGEDAAPSMTNSYGLSLRYRDKKENSTFKIDYEVIGHEYMEPFVDDYMSHDVKIGYEWRWGSNWSVRTVGRLEMSEYGDRYGVKPEIAYQVNPRSLVSFYGGHRTKVFHDYRERIDQDRFLGMKYMSKIGKQTLELRYQRNYNDSEKERYDHVTSKYTVGYHVPWNKRARTLFRLDYTPREYQSRFIMPEADDMLEFGTLRHDQGWTFAIVSRFALTKTLEIVPRYVLQDRYSNDPTIDEMTLHVPSISLRGRW